MVISMLGASLMYLSPNNPRVHGREFVKSSSAALVRARSIVLFLGVYDVSATVRFLHGEESHKLYEVETSKCEQSAARVNVIGECSYLREA